MAWSPFRIQELTALDVEMLPQDDDTASLLIFFKKEFAACRSRPEWCFAAESNGQTVGVLGYHAPAAHQDLAQTPQTLILFFLQCDSSRDSDYLEVGRALLEYSLPKLRSLGVSTVKWSFDSAAFWDEIPFPSPHWQQQLELAQRTGMSLRQEKINYQYRLGFAAPAGAPPLLIFRTLQEVGEAAYVEAIQSVMQGTLDRNDAASYRQLGPEQAAQRFFASIREDMAYEPRLWKLAYTSTEAFVGLIAPLKMWGDIGTLGYIGVAPEHRGKGYGVALLQQGHTDLQTEGIRRIIADTDALNLPMQRTFEKTGYQLQGQSWSYEAHSITTLYAGG